MKKILGYLSAFIKEVDKPLLFICTFFIAGMIVLNYGAGLELNLVNTEYLPFPGFSGRWVLFSITFGFPYMVLFGRTKRREMGKGFLFCLIAAPFLFALKAGITIDFPVSADESWNLYWNKILYWPLRTVIMSLLLIGCWRLFHRDKEMYGLRSKGMNWRPYWMMLLCMLPLIAAASTQADFLATYPKVRNILPLPSGAEPGWLYKLFYELGYGSDFFSIEFFFRGFLVIGFSKWAGKEAIIPMACFYCSIHFGKPLGECISSYFGGLLLGIVSYNTRSIYGGLVVHLGIAWLMEVGALLGRAFIE